MSGCGWFAKKTRAHRLIAAGCVNLWTSERQRLALVLHTANTPGCRTQCPKHNGLYVIPCIIIAPYTMRRIVGTHWRGRCLYTCPRTCLQTCLYTCPRTCLQTCLYPCPRTCLYTCLHTCLHTCRRFSLAREMRAVTTLELLEEAEAGEDERRLSAKMSRQLAKAQGELGLLKAKPIHRHKHFCRTCLSHMSTHMPK